MYYFSADYHLNDENILQYRTRPFNSMEEMNSKIITMHNATIRKTDTLIHIGDFCTVTKKYTEEYWRRQLNGNIIFMRGNHDKKEGIHTIITRMIIKEHGIFFYLVHKPKKSQSRIPCNLVGHVHESWKHKENKNRGQKYSVLVNVGVDVWNYTPVTSKQILTYLLRNHISVNKLR